MKTKHRTACISYTRDRRRNQPTRQTKGTLLAVLWSGTPGRTRPRLCALPIPFNLPDCRGMAPSLRSLHTLWLPGGDAHLQDTREQKQPRSLSWGWTDRRTDRRCDPIRSPDTQDLQQAAGFWSYFGFV